MEIRSQTLLFALRAEPRRTLRLRAQREKQCLAPYFFLALATNAFAQAPARPQFHAVRNVRLVDAADATKVTLVLRDGRITDIADAASEPPIGSRVIDGQGLLALPAFIDAYTHAGCATPAPAIDRDLAPKPNADVWIDMREADRKGVEPSFHAADAFKLEEEVKKRYRSTGFGALVSAPHGQLLSGASALVSTRDAATRDLLLLPVAFEHAGFECTGPGYPSTLMGSIAQLRQFFLDAQRNRLLAERRSAGKTGSRPAYDTDVEAIAPVLDKHRRIVCEAETAGDIERFIALADEFQLDIAISGGREAWKRASLLAARKIPVILTLEWGEEIEDPHAKDKQEPERKDEASKVEKPEASKPEKPELQKRPPSPESNKPAVEQPKAEPTQPAQTSEKKGETIAASGVKTPDKDASTYEEPLRVREEKRRLWEESRDCAIKLDQAGVVFAFGSGKSSSKDLVEHVRTLVEKGLPVASAVRALTTTPAQWLGLPSNLGKIERGFDATIALWSANPLTSKDAKLAWLIVEGFPYEQEQKSNELKGKPDEGVDISGKWTFDFESPAAKPAKGELEMKHDGSVKGTIRYRNPADDSEMAGTFEGHVAGKKVKLEGSVKIGEYQAHVEIEGEIQGDEIIGTTDWKWSGGEDSRRFKASKDPQREERDVRIEEDFENEPHDRKQEDRR